MHEITVANLFFYPIKSCRGIEVQVAEVGPMGIMYDRQWMVVDEATGMFIGQNADHSKKLGIEIRSMCLIETAILDDTLVLSAPGMPNIGVPLAGCEGPDRNVQVWRTECRGVDQGDAAAKWLTAFLSRERPGRYTLVRMPDAGQRQAKTGEARLAYADRYPFLVLSKPSLDDLNVRMAKKGHRALDFDRFRPNIVLDGCAMYAEDAIPLMTAGEVTLAGTNTCVRCPLTTINQQTGKQPSKEPLATLSTYRKTSEGVTFGRHFNHLTTGVIKVGDKVKVNLGGRTT